MPSIGDMRAWILMDGKRLEEHHVEKVGDSIVKCHIQSETGKSFHIGIGEYSGDRRGLYPIAAIELDGHELEGGWPITAGNKERIIDGLSLVDSFQPFIFAELTVTEHDDERGMSGQVGLIKVRLNWKRRDQPISGLSARKGGLHDPQPLHEKAKR